MMCAYAVQEIDIQMYYAATYVLYMLHAGRFKNLESIHYRTGL